MLFTGNLHANITEQTVSSWEKKKKDGKLEAEKTGEGGRLEIMLILYEGGEIGAYTPRVYPFP